MKRITTMPLCVKNIKSTERTKGAMAIIDVINAQNLLPPFINRNAPCKPTISATKGMIKNNVNPTMPPPVIDNSPKNIELKSNLTVISAQPNVSILSLVWA